MLDFFDSYTDLGWQVIPIRPLSKVPCFRKWNGWYDHDYCRTYLVRNPGANLGLRLGGIVDVEADTPEANDRLWQLIGDFPHPVYRSQKSYHHLFLTPDWRLTRMVIKDIEFRGRKHHSVLPPSINSSGIQYFWLKQSVFTVPKMPKALVRLYRSGKPLDGMQKVWCSCCLRKKPIHKKRLALEVEAFRLRGLLWQCRECRRIDVREDCRKIRRKRYYKVCESMSPQSD